MERAKDRKGKFRPGMGVIVLYLTIGVVFLVNAPGGARGAEKYPTSSVDIIVPFSAGGSTDLLARFIATELSKRWGQPVNVVNKPGGNGVVGTQAAMAAAPDGYTLFCDGPGSSSALMGLKGLPFDVLNRTYLIRGFAVPMTIISSIKAPWNSLQELADAGRKDPSSVLWGAAAGGRGASDIAFLQYLEVAGIDAPKTRRVEFGGSSAAINALGGEHIKLHSAGPAVVTPIVSAGKAKALGVTSPKRVSMLPNCPTTREAGFPAADYQWWGGLSGPPGLPAHVQEIIVRVVEDILKDPSVVDRLAKNFDSTPAFLGPEAFKGFVQEEGNKIVRLQKFMLGIK